VDSLLREWDGESAIIRFDRNTGAWIIIAIHSARLGPATGGTRMKPYPDLQAALRDVLRLAAGMTYKFALADLARGGGKAVNALPTELDPHARPDLLPRYGAPYVFCRTPAKGGAGGSGQAAALVVFSGMQAVCEYLFGDESLAGRRVLVQGAGSVGGRLIDLLREAGAAVLFSDVDQATIRHFRDELGLHFVPADEVYNTS
jgi:leucine dehydrogenase